MTCTYTYTISRNFPASLILTIKFRTPHGHEIMKSIKPRSTFMQTSVHNQPIAFMTLITLGDTNKRAAYLHAVNA